MYKQAQFKYRRMVGRVSLGIAVAGLIAASTHSPFGGEIDAADTIHLNGGGSTFAQPFYSLWIDTYQKARPNVKLNYQGIGSGGGIKAVQAGTLDWGGTDAPMTDDEQAASKVGHVLNLPVAIGPVVVSYNLPGVGAGLNLSRQALVDIYLGKVTRWNDSEITDANPGKALPNLPIAVVHRSDASGTSYIFTDYLSHVSATWRQSVGTAKSPNWPVGLGGAGNPGVSGLIRQIPGAIGYIEYAYARQNELPVAALENRSSRYVEPDTDSARLAAQDIELPDDFAVSIVDSANPAAYPIVSFTWMMIPAQAADGTARALRDFAKWGLTEGQKLLPQLDYVPIPRSVVERELAALDDAPQMAPLGGNSR